MAIFLKVLFLLIQILLLSTNLIAQKKGNNESLIPLEKEIRICILSVDSTTLREYNLYHFKYKKKNKTVKASFWSEKYNCIFNIGTTTIVLYRIHSMRSYIGSDSIELRRLDNELVIYEDNVFIKKFEFSEYAKYPTFRLCL